MALPRLTRPLERPGPLWLAGALALAAATTLAAGGAVTAIQDDELPPGSRLPITSNKPAPSSHGSASTVPTPKPACPHIHKCAGGTNTARP